MSTDPANPPSVTARWGWTFVKILVVLLVAQRFLVGGHYDQIDRVLLLIGIAMIAGIAFWLITRWRES